jgi:hypothetical protein
MSRIQNGSNEFSRKWQAAGADAHRENFGKPIARILWRNAVEKDDGFKLDGGSFDFQTALTAWMKGWIEAEIQNRKKGHGAQEEWERRVNRDTRTPQEIEELRNSLNAIINFPPSAEDMHLYDRVHEDKRFVYACNVLDTLDWILGEISTKDFLSDSYMGLEHLRDILKNS